MGKANTGITRRELIGTASAALALSVIPLPTSAANTAFIMPSISFCENVKRIADNENTYTLVYEIMDRFDFSKDTYERARVGSARYAAWLESNVPEDGIPPHIQFGGCIVPGKGDPTFKARWAARTRALLASGDLV